MGVEAIRQAQADAEFAAQKMFAAIENQDASMGAGGQYVRCFLKEVARHLVEYRGKRFQTEEAKASLASAPAHQRQSAQQRESESEDIIALIDEVLGHAEDIAQCHTKRDARLFAKSVSARIEGIRSTIINTRRCSAKQYRAIHNMANGLHKWSNESY